MDSYDVVITQRAQEQLEAYIRYILLTLMNEQAARSVWQDALLTGQQLSSAAGSLPFCRHPALKERGYRSISFRRHQYIMIYHIRGNIAYVDAVYHQLQDYENAFAEDLV